ncbi:MAG TPA: hypothetical protein VK158_05770 [Acidobacteriota bacterium]|nr:hypothetical protein [Acidobacteriota bacterium]
MEPKIIGIIGCLLLIYAWLVSTIQAFRLKQKPHSVVFTVIYVCASGLLTWYSFLVDDIVFVVLNGIAGILALLTLLIGSKHGRRNGKK